MGFAGFGLFAAMASWWVSQDSGYLLQWLLGGFRRIRAIRSNGFLVGFAGFGTNDIRCNGSWWVLQDSGYSLQWLLVAFAGFGLFAAMAYSWVSQDSGYSLQRHFNVMRQNIKWMHPDHWRTLMKLAWTYHRHRSKPITDTIIDRSLTR